MLYARVGQSFNSAARLLVSNCAANLRHSHCGLRIFCRLFSKKSSGRSFWSFGHLVKIVFGFAKVCYNNILIYYYRHFLAKLKFILTILTLTTLTIVETANARQLIQASLPSLNRSLDHFDHMSCNNKVTQTYVVLTTKPRTPLKPI